MLKSWNTFLSIGSVVDLSAFMSCFVVQLNTKYWAQEMKLGGFSYPETQTVALMVSSDLQNLQICSESGIMKQQRVNPFKIGSKCQGVHFKHTDTGSLTVIAQQPTNNSSAPSQTLYLLYQNCQQQTLNVKILLCPNTRLFWNTGIQKWKKKTPLPFKMMHFGFSFYLSSPAHLFPGTLPPLHPPAFSKSLHHQLLGKGGKMLLGWQSQLREHRSHQSEKAVLLFGFVLICSSGATSLGGSVTGWLFFYCTWMKSS